MLHALLHALAMSATMAWEILWALILGFALSAVVQAVVSKEEMSRLLPDDRPRTIVIAFLFADLIVLPILDIYRKYYGLKVSALLLGCFYVSMAGAALVIEFLFRALHLIPQERKAQIVEASIHWNYTTFLNIGFLALAAVMVVVFLRTGGPEMLRMMSQPQSEHAHSDDSEHDPHHGRHRAA